MTRSDTLLPPLLPLLLLLPLRIFSLVDHKLGMHPNSSLHPLPPQATLLVPAKMPPAFKIAGSAAPGGPRGMPAPPTAACTSLSIIATADTMLGMSRNQ